MPLHTGKERHICSKVPGSVNCLSASKARLDRTFAFLQPGFVQSTCRMDYICSLHELVLVTSTTVPASKLAERIAGGAKRTPRLREQGERNERV